jgi:hypothetical protein
MFKEYILSILNKSNLIKIIFLIAPGFVLEARHNKPRAIKDRILIRLKQFESYAIPVKMFIPPYDCSILCIIYIYVYVYLE